MEFTFSQCVPVFRNGEIYKYNTSITAENLAKLFELGTLVYEGDLQRGYKKNKKGQLKDVYSVKHVKDILRAMLEDNIHGGMITLNYSKDNDIDLEYNSDESTISGDGVLQILDGQHRIRACKMWLDMYKKDENSVPNPAHFMYPVVIENLSNDKAKMLFSEYSITPMKISRSRSEYLNVSDYSNKIARLIMNESELKGKIETVSTSTKGSRAVITFSVLTYAIRNSFKPSTSKDADKIGGFLVDFFNELVELFPDNLGNDVDKRVESRRYSFVGEVLSFYGYLDIASKLRKENKWKNKLKKLTEEVTVGSWTGEFMSKENPIWKYVFRDNDKIINNSSTQSYVQKVLSAWVIDDKLITSPEQLAS